ncbi:MAG: serine/threonine-protein kinase [Thermoanaerobaculia bacterium]
MVETLPVGSRFGDYEILEELGSGGMGKVYRAKDVTLERNVALKTLAAATARDPAYVQRFLREARAVARLNHANIVQIYNFGSVDGTWYLAMEYVDGLSLGQRLRSGRFPEAEAVRIARQVCQALALAHAEGLIHRDIKPDNIMLTSRGDVKLVDLGIAKRLDEDQSLTQTGHSMGTPHYISPEQIRGQKDIDARADIYSLGATLYHLVTGRTPYQGASGAVVMSMHLVEPLPDPRRYEPTLSEGFCSVLRKMLAKNREERYANVAALEVGLFRLHEGQTPRPPGPAGSGFETAAEATVDLSTPSPPAPTPATPAPPDAVIPEGDLARLESALARQIGPLARVLVRKAARAGGTYAHLASRLEENIPGEGGRRAFRDAVRKPRP